MKRKIQYNIYLFNIFFYAGVRLAPVETLTDVLRRHFVQSKRFTGGQSVLVRSGQRVHRSSGETRRTVYRVRLVSVRHDAVCGHALDDVQPVDGRAFGVGHQAIPCP